MPHGQQSDTLTLRPMRRLNTFIIDIKINTKLCSIAAKAEVSVFES